MCYILYMNKDVIYVEPDDDITDIITKIEGSKEKIIALVPPKKAGVFRSVVNIKLIAKAGNTSGKKIVLVTTDPSITKLAGATKLPVTKDLQSAPSIPEIEMVAEETVEEAVAEVENDDENEESEKPAEKEPEPEDDDEEDEEFPEEKPKKAKPSAKPIGNKVLDWIKSHKKLSIFLGIFGVVLILVMIWALVIAPAVELEISIKTDANNFSETINFTTSLNDEKLEDGKFYLEEKKIESSQEVKFEATGEKNVGEKASGEVTVIARIGYNGGSPKTVVAGDKFTINGLSFIANNDVTMQFDGSDYSVCSNIDEDTPIGKAKAEGCQIYATIKVTAAEPGSKYNISPSETGWTTTADVAAYSSKAMAGGTDDIMKIVQQSDVDKAKNELASSDESDDKKKLYEEINDSSLIIESSFKHETSSAVSTPAVGEEVKDGVTPTLKATTTTSVFVIDKTKVEEYIKSKVKIDDNQRIYEIREPFIESFMETNNGYTGKLKAVYYTGPKITENDVIEKVKGKGLGEAQHDLKDINGVAEVHVEKSFPWVMSIPGDPNKITITFEVKDQNGNKIEQGDSESEENSTEDNEESNSEEETKEN